MRFSIWSFIRMFEMWFLTVFGLMWSSPAIIALSLPLAISLRTSSSRSESSARIVSSASGEPAVALACLSCDLDPALLEQVAETRAEQIVIVYEQDASTRGLAAGLGALAHRSPFGGDEV